VVVGRFHLGAPPQPKPKFEAKRQPAPSTQNGHATGGAKLAKAERLALTALAQYPQGRSKNQVAILTGYAVNGGGFNNAISALRTNGFITGGGDNLEITQEGLAALGSYDPLPSGQALLDHWMRQLSKAERAALARSSTRGQTLCRKKTWRPCWLRAGRRRLQQCSGPAAHA
jgi:hypothetical protein